MRNKNLKFGLKCRGYDVKAVNSYIDAEKKRSDEVQLLSSERIADLKTQVSELTKELTALRGREEQIKAALISATQNADKLLSDVKGRCAEELNRLRLFRAKWTGAYEQLKERYHFDKDALNMESVAISVELELQKMLMQDFSFAKGTECNEMEAYFKSEVDRLSKSPQKPEPVITPAVKELKDRLKGAKKESAFSFDEALNPTDSLADICKTLIP